MDHHFTPVGTCTSGDKASIQQTRSTNNSRNIGDVDAAGTDFPVQIRIQRLVIFTGGIVCVAFVSVTMWLCVNDGGIVLETFNSIEKDELMRRTLLNVYNSYSGSIMSVLIKPVELFLAIALAVGMLCFATELNVGDRHTARTYWLLFVATAATGYLLTNGFSAINVQLVSRPVQSKINARDLSQRAVDDSFRMISSARISDVTFNRTLLEETVRSPSSNTALRSAFLPIEPTPDTYCIKRWDPEERDSLAASFGFAQHTWQSQVLTEAVEPTKLLEFALDTNTTEKLRVLSSHGVATDALELPMNTSTAINLVIHGVMLVEKKLKWWRHKGSVDSFLEDRTQDLVKVYGAECVDEDATMCHGLRYNLSSSGSDLSQHLVVGKRSLPMEVRANSSPTNTLLPLVSFAYNQPCDDRNPIPSSADLVLARCFTDATGLANKSVPLLKYSCAPRAGLCLLEGVEPPIHREEPPAGVHGDDGVVRDVFNISTSSSSGKAAQETSDSLIESLAFLRNAQLVDVKLSSPLLNVVLSLVGCTILLAVCMSVGLLGKKLETKLQQMVTAHTIAEVLIDDRKFPSLLVKTTLMPDGDHFVMMHQSSENSGSDGETAPTPILDGFRVRHVLLEHPDGRVVKLGSSKLRETRSLTVV